MMSGLQIKPIPVLRDNYVWCIIHAPSRTACIVDPGDAVPVQHFLQQHQLSLRAILLTHHHADHTHGVSALKSMYHVPVYGSVNSPITAITHGIQDGDSIHIDTLSLTLRALAIPGHTLDHTAYYAEGMLFTGDTLFGAGCGRVFEGTMAQMYASLQTLAALPDSTLIYCGHEYTSNNLRFAATVEPENPDILQRIQHVTALRENHLPSLPSTLHDEKRTNPFLRCKEPTVIHSAETYAKQTLSSEVDVFTWIRTWKDQFN